MNIRRLSLLGLPVVGLVLAGLPGSGSASGAPDLTPPRIVVFEPAGPTAPRSVTPQPIAPLEETFRLHSLAGATRVVYLDFDGVHLSADNNWVTAGYLPAGAWPGYSLDASPTFSAAERAHIQSIWAYAAEAFAAFQIDVTTEDPGTEALWRSSVQDAAYGAHVVLSSENWCSIDCAGIASFSTFDEVADEPAQSEPHGWAFTAVGGDPFDDKGIGTTIAHETGHNLALSHDGVPSNEYYLGHGTWAPMMGADYYRPIVQWSKGEYPDATEQEDDLALIASHGAPLRSDEAPSSVSDPAPWPDGQAYITSAADVDSFVAPGCLERLTVTASSGFRSCRWTSD